MSSYDKESMMMMVVGGKEESSCSSVSSMSVESTSGFGSGSAGSGSGTGSYRGPLTREQAANVNAAVAMVTNKWDRELVRQEQDVTRKLTLLRQRKVSAVLKVENLKKSLKDTSDASPRSVKSRLAQVKELEDAVNQVDAEVCRLQKEREETAIRLNKKKVNHIATLHKLGLLEIIGSPEDEESGSSSLRWKSEVDLKSNSADDRENFASLQPQSAGHEGYNQKQKRGRKFSPPLAVAAKLLSESKMRSGSDPSLLAVTSSTVNESPKIRSSGPDENRRPQHIVSSLISGVWSKSTANVNANSNNNYCKARMASPEASPKTTRRNPLRMLSNAIDFRGRKRNPTRPKSADFNKINSDPMGIPEPSYSDKYLVAPATPLSSVADPASQIPVKGPGGTVRVFLSDQEFVRHSMPNLDPLDLEEAASIVKADKSRKQTRFQTQPEELKNPTSVTSSDTFYATNYATNPRNNKANGLVVSGASTKVMINPKFPGREPHLLPPLENRNSAPEIVVTGTSNKSVTQPKQQQQPIWNVKRSPGGLEDRINKARLRVQSGFQSLSGSYSSQTLNLPPKNAQHIKPKLSSRFQSAQKLNNRLLTNFSQGVKRSRTFNIRDVQDELAAIGKVSSTSSGTHYHHNSRTLPHKNKQNQHQCNKSTGSSSSTSSSRKSSNSSTGSARSSHSSNNGHLRTEIKSEALEEIAAFEAFANEFLTGDNVCNGTENRKALKANNTMSKKLSTKEMESELVV